MGSIIAIFNRFFGHYCYCNSSEHYCHCPDITFFINNISFFILAHLNETFYKSVKTRSDSLSLSKPRSDFKVWVDINEVTVIKEGKLSSAGVMIHLKRDGLGLLLGSFYVPTGIFAILAMTSYVINPDAVGYVSNLIYLNLGLVHGK